MKQTIGGALGKKEKDILSDVLWNVLQKRYLNYFLKSRLYSMQYAK